MTQSQKTHLPLPSKILPSAKKTTTPTPTSLWIGTYNIRDGRGLGGDGGLITSLRAVREANLDLVILTETKISNEIYTKAAFDYKVDCTAAQHGPRGGGQGGIALVY